MRLLPVPPVDVGFHSLRELWLENFPEDAIAASLRRLSKVIEDDQRRALNRAFFGPPVTDQEVHAEGDRYVRELFGVDGQPPDEIAGGEIGG